MSFHNPFRPRLSQVEIERRIEAVSAKHEIICQRGAYLHLVVIPLREIGQKLAGELYSEHLLGEINYRIREKVKEWVERHAWQGRDFTIDRFLWTVRFNNTGDGLEFDEFPQILKDLEQGTAKLQIFRPEYDKLMSLINDERSN